jgi:hypothetical protein
MAASCNYRHSSRHPYKGAGFLNYMRRVFYENSSKEISQQFNNYCNCFFSYVFHSFVKENKDIEAKTELVFYNQETYAGDIVTVTVGIKKQSGNYCFWCNFEF